MRSGINRRSGGDASITVAASAFALSSGLEALASMMEEVCKAAMGQQGPQGNESPSRPHN